MIQNLKKIDQAKEEFINLSAHHLRTPLTIIKGYTSMLLDGSFGVIKNKEEKKALKVIYQSNERLLQLAEKLLTILNLELEELELNYEIIDLSKLTDKIVKNFKKNIGNKKIKIVYKKTKNLSKVKVDQEMFKQVIKSLVDNSIKYTKTGKIDIKIYQEKNNVCFSVVDTGVGMNKYFLKSLFQKFSRSNKVFDINPEGTGLDLYLSQKIIKIHGGNIWAESEGIQKGSAFYFSLPKNKKL